MMSPSRYGPSLYLGLAVWTVTLVSAPAPPSPPTPERGFVYVKDDTVATGVKWAHALPSLIPFVLIIGPTSVFGASEAEVFISTPGDMRAMAVISGAVSARVVMNVSAPGPSGVIACQYSLDSGATWNYLDGLNGPFAGLDVIDYHAGAWAALDAAAKDDVMLRLVSYDGDGITNMSVGSIYVEFSSHGEA